MLMELRRIALTVMIALSSFSYGQSDTTKNIAKPAEPGYDIQSANIERSGELIQTAGILYNASSAIAILGSTTGSILISNGDTESGLIVTSASGIAAYILQTVGNVKLASGGKQLIGTEQVGNSSKTKNNLGNLSLELRPRFGYRTGSYTATNPPIRNVRLHQYYFGSPDIRYSNNDLFIRFGVAFSYIREKTDIIDPNRTDYSNSYTMLSPSIGLGLTREKNEFSLGYNTIRWDDMSLINFDYSYYLKESLALSLTLYYDLFEWSLYSDLMPSIGMTYNIGR